MEQTPWPMSGQQSPLPSSTKDSKLTCSDFTLTLHSMTHLSITIFHKLTTYQSNSRECYHQLSLLGNKTFTKISQEKGGKHLLHQETTSGPFFALLSINQPVNQSTNQSINQSINQYISKSVSQWKLYCHLAVPTKVVQQKGDHVSLGTQTQ